ncbi:hypothetical protein [Umezawaea beigongshangensis]|uniref:hypothetical protein n=1 Tax=Umezawaea beigongshangensis TaxID=2780383 RepID=UPI0018F1F603|nr:hypothetical protein [Umezawaea beigongshangensis]
MARPKDTTTTKSRTRTIGAAVAAMASVAGTVLAAAPAAATVAAYPTSTFSIEVGASYYRGTVTWYNRSVGVDGAFKATGYRRIYAQAWASTTWLGWQSSSTWYNTSGPAALPLTADVEGGATEVDVWMTSGDAYDGLEFFTCYRGVSVCSGPYVGRPYAPPLDG